LTQRGEASYHFSVAPIGVAVSPIATSTRRKDLPTMASENVKELNEGNFQQEVIDKGGVAVVDFWAEWCMPCKMLAPTLDELAAEYGDTVTIGKVDIDNSRELAMQYDVRSIPTLVFFKDGQIAKKVVGLKQKSELKGVIDEIMQ
jgi:thioredoxin 1